jgi:hypothetical protein
VALVLKNPTMKSPDAPPNVDSGTVNSNAVTKAGSTKFSFAFADPSVG